MALKVPTLHYSTASFYNGLNFHGSGPQNAGAFVKPGLSGLNQLAQGVQQLNQTQHKIRMEEQQEALDLALLEDLQKYGEETDIWTSQYTDEHRGANAANAEDAAREFHAPRLQALADRYAHNPTALLYLKRHGAALAQKNIDSMRAYEYREKDKHAQSIFDGQEAAFVKVALDHNSTPEQIQAAFAEFNHATTAYHARRGTDPQATALKNQGVYEKAMHQRQNMDMELLIAEDLGQARQIVHAALGRPTATLPEEVAVLAEKEAAAQGVSPALVKAVIATESAGRQSAVSPAGARGLMQLMPGTAQDLGVNPDNAAQNVRGGVTYLKRMLEKYNGNERLALAAYNWGPGNVDNFLKTGLGVKGQPMPRETKDYVARILGAPLELNAEPVHAEASPEELTTAAGPDKPEKADEEEAPDPAILQKAAELQKYCTPLELLAWERKIEKEGEERAKKQRLQNLSTVYASLRQQVEGLEPEDADELMGAHIEAHPDEEMRKGLKSRWAMDKAVNVMRRKAADVKSVKNFKAYVEQQGALPSHALYLIDQANISDAAKDSLRKYYTGESKKVTLANTQKFGELLVAIDNGDVVLPEEVEIYAFDHSLTGQQEKQAHAYLKREGNTGLLSYSRTKSIYKSLTKKDLDKNPEFFELVKQALPPGKSPTEPEVRRTISHLLMEGERKGSNFMSWGYGKDMTYAEALKKDVADTWLPDVTAKEDQEIRAILKKQNVTRNLDQRVREYKRVHIMNLPPLPKEGI